MKDKTGLRTADFWTSLALFALGVAMIGGAATFPMTDSYGGVRNVWYVSPALFPLLVAATLVVLSAVLLVNSIVTGGARRALAGFGKAIGGLSARDRRLDRHHRADFGLRVWTDPANGLLRRDGPVSASVRRRVLCRSSDARKGACRAFCGISVVVGALAALGVPRTRGSDAALLIDVAGVAVFAALAAYAYACVVIGRERMEDRRRLRIALAVSVGVPWFCARCSSISCSFRYRPKGWRSRPWTLVHYALRGL